MDPLADIEPNGLQSPQSDILSSPSKSEHPDDLSLNPEEEDGEPVLSGDDAEEEDLKSPTSGAEAEAAADEEEDIKEEEPKETPFRFVHH